MLSRERGRSIVADTNDLSEDIKAVLASGVFLTEEFGIRMTDLFKPFSNGDRDLGGAEGCHYNR